MLVALFLRMFDLRRIQLSPHTGYIYDIAEIELVEDDVNECAISMVCKLDDITFRPMFLRMLEWTTFPTSKMDMKATIHRQITWYKFLIKFFGTLKVWTRFRLDPAGADHWTSVYRHQLRCSHNRRRRRNTERWSPH